MRFVLWALAGFAGFCVAVGVVGNRRRRGGAGRLDPDRDPARLRAQVEAHARTIGHSGGHGVGAP